MSQYVDRNRVLSTTKVRTSLKDDGCWIQRSEPEEKRTELNEEAGPAKARQNSYVFSTAKIFESVSAPVSPPPKQTTEGESATLVNGEVIPPQDDAQPGASTVETTDDTKPQAPTEEHVQNGHVKPENPVTDTAEENKEGLADAPVDQTNVEDKEPVAEVSGDIHVENEELTSSFSMENPEAAVSAEQAEQPVVTAESEGQHADTTAEQSNSNVTQAKVSADAHVEDPVAETTGVAGAGEKEDQPQEETPTEPANDAPLEETRVESTERAAATPQEDTGDVIQAVPAVVVESSHDTSDSIQEAPLLNSVEPVPDVLHDSLAKSLNLHPASESLNQSAPNTTVESEESNVEAAAPAEASLKTSAVETLESEVQELDITDAVEPAAAPEGGAVQSVPSDGDIELTNASAVEAPTTEAAPEPEAADDPKQTPSEEATQHQSDDTSIAEIIQKPREEQQSQNTLKVTSDGKAICSFCDQVIDGRIKLTFSEPLMTCHAECLKCAMCAKGLGELLIPMFLRDQMIQCDGCFFLGREG